LFRILVIAVMVSPRLSGRILFVFDSVLVRKFGGGFNQARIAFNRQ